MKVLQEAHSGVVRGHFNLKLRSFGKDNNGLLVAKNEARKL